VTDEVVARVRRSGRYRDVDPSLVERLAGEELGRARTIDEAVKRVKRRLHQAVGAFRGGGARGLRAADTAARDARDADPRTAATKAMAQHASTRERLPYLGRFYGPIWDVTGRPTSVLDLGCGLHPLGLPWMGISATSYVAIDVDGRVLETVSAFLTTVGQPYRAEARDLVAAPPVHRADVAFALKLVTTLDRQDPDAAARLVRALDVGHAVVSFATRTLAGRADRRAATYRDRLERLAADSGRVEAIVDVSIPAELVWVLTLGPRDG
jgi:16S rRNA (guanine(1405)-N(7))-methyltransferase